MNSTAKKIQFLENSSILIVQAINFFCVLILFMRKGFIPPALVGNAPSQFGRGTRTNCSNEKRDNLVENPSQAKPSHSSSSSTSSTSPLSLSQRYRF
jgi:hypothetical protein